MSNQWGVWIGALGLALLGLVIPKVNAQPGPAGPGVARAPVVLDTDIGTGIDDAFALALILGSHELDLRGVTTVGGDTENRALILCRFLTMTGRRHVAVAGGQAPQPAHPLDGQARYSYHPDVIFNRTQRPVKESAVDFLYARLKAQPGQVTLIATGPLTNVARLLADRPDSKGLLRRIVFPG